MLRPKRIQALRFCALKNLSGLREIRCTRMPQVFLRTCLILWYNIGMRYAITLLAVVVMAMPGFGKRAFDLYQPIIDRCPFGPPPEDPSIPPDLVSKSSGAAGDGAETDEEGRTAALENLSLDIRKGETVAFTGHSGCGKSTALKLLMCIYPPDAGSRYLRFTDGSRQELDARFRRLFAYVPQGNALMRGTLREVVSFAAPGRAGDDEALWRALEIACADGFVRELKEGLDTQLGERGAGLSEGQMQRIAIARAIFAESPVLLLDEATSALDGETERRLLENLRRMTDKTVVIVTHRPAALEICDRVLCFTENDVETFAGKKDMQEQTVADGTEQE